MKTIRTRIAAVAATGLLVAAPVAFAPSAAAIGSVDGDDVATVIEGEDGYAAITTLSATVEEPGDIEYRDEDGNLVDPDPAANPEGIDRSDLARPAPIVDEDGDGFEDIMPLEGGTPIVDEDGDGFEDITPLGDAEIEPISAELDEDGSSAAGWIIGGAAAAVVIVGGVVVVRRRAAA